MEINRLTKVEVDCAREGLHYDGGGIILQVKGEGRSWLFRYRLAGRRREMGLGSYPTVSLAEARRKAVEARRLVAEGKDPIDAREAQKRTAAPPRGITFAAAAERYIEAREPGWKYPRYADEWRVSLRVHARRLSRMDVAAIGTEDVLACLEPIWHKITPTAAKVRGRIEAVLRWAATKGYREKGFNPARWEDHLEDVLDEVNKIHRVTHLESMPYEDVPAFVAELRQSTGITARALELTILTACRVNEVAKAQWGEVDLGKAMWTVPAARTKNGRTPHEVPLADRSVAVLQSMRQVRVSGWVFPGMRPSTPLSGMAMLMQLRRMRSSGLTVHGFRSSFKNWALEQTDFPDFLSEMALGHISADRVRAAYARTKLVEKRREMVQAWAAWCEPRA